MTRAKLWTKLSKKKINDRICKALDNNVNFLEEDIIGIPGSHLDEKVFYNDAPFLKDAPYMSMMVRNPNHIGCHTLGNSERFFSGTQELEKELIQICGQEIMRGGLDEEFDGYVSSGGTEANLQAIWIYRNYFMYEMQSTLDEICIVCSEDSHYSMHKASNLMQIEIAIVPVDDNNRSLKEEALHEQLLKLKESGKKHFIIVANMMTTMFGSVDNIHVYTEALKALDLSYKIHIDAAFGGFFYPFTDAENALDFSNPEVSSITLDAHKMVQAPYGTGVFLIRKNYMEYVKTTKASYVAGHDITLIGSRSGANAIAVWMILRTYGRYGWIEKISILLKRAHWLAKKLTEKKITYYWHPNSNIFTIRAQFVSDKIAYEFGLVPDNHDSPNWYKIVIMEHVEFEHLIMLVDRFGEQ